MDQEAGYQGRGQPCPYPPLRALRASAVNSPSSRNPWNKGSPAGAEIALPLLPGGESLFPSFSRAVHGRGGNPAWQEQLAARPWGGVANLQASRTIP